jgi:hypothetical protein
MLAPARPIDPDMDVSGVSPEAAVMAAASGSASMKATEAGIAVLSRIQRESRQTADALVGLIQAASPKPGVGEHISIYA